MKAVVHQWEKLIQILASLTPLTFPNYEVVIRTWIWGSLYFCKPPFPVPGVDTDGQGSVLVKFVYTFVALRVYTVISHTLSFCCASCSNKVLCFYVSQLHVILYLHICTYHLYYNYIKGNVGQREREIPCFIKSRICLLRA